MLKPHDLDVIQTRLRAAPQGPWVWLGEGAGGEPRGLYAPGPPVIPLVVPVVGKNGVPDLAVEKGALFVLAASVRDVGRLAGEVERLREVLLCLAGLADSSFTVEDVKAVVADGLGLTMREMARELPWGCPCCEDTWDPEDDEEYDDFRPYDPYGDML